MAEQIGIMESAGWVPKYQKDGTTFKIMVKGDDDRSVPYYCGREEDEGIRQLAEQFIGKRVKVTYEQSGDYRNPIDFEAVEGPAPSSSGGGDKPDWDAISWGKVRTHILGCWIQSDYGLESPEDWQAIDKLTEYCMTGQHPQTAPAPSQGQTKPAQVIMDKVAAEAALDFDKLSRSMGTPQEPTGPPLELADIQAAVDEEMKRIKFNLSGAAAWLYEHYEVKKIKGLNEDELLDAYEKLKKMEPASIKDLS